MAVRAAILIVFGSMGAAVVTVLVLFAFSPTPAIEGADQATAGLGLVNGGRSRTACLFGGCMHPIRTMVALGALVSRADHARLAEATLRRLTPVEEFEVLIA